MKLWTLITPEFGTVIPVLDDGSGPMEYGCDVIDIEAETKRDALILGVAEMLKDYKFSWCRSARRDGESPYAGIKVMERDPVAEAEEQAQWELVYAAENMADYWR